MTLERKKKYNLEGMNIKESMKILFISHSSVTGGAENILFALLKNLPKDKFECHCIFPRSGVLEEKIRSLEIKTYILGLKWWISNKEDIVIGISEFCFSLRTRIDQIVDIIRSNSIDLVVTNTIAIGDGAIAAKVAGVPHLWHAHELLNSDPRLRALIDLKYFYYLIHNLSDHIVAASAAVKTELERFSSGPSAKIEVIHNGIEVPDTESGEKTDEITVVSAGYICKRKGLSALLDSAAHVTAVIPKAKFIIYGNASEDDYYASLLKERKRKKLRNQFIFKGFRKDLGQFLKNASVVVVPSISEPFSMVLLEAMSLGRPVVATACGGLPELIVDGETGFLVPVNDSGKLAEKILYLLQNKEMAERMGEKGQERARKVFNIDIFISRFINAFDNAIIRQKSCSTGAVDINMLIEIMNSIGENHGEIKHAFDLYAMMGNSLIYKIYKKFDSFKHSFKKLTGISD